MGGTGRVGGGDRMGGAEETDGRIKIIVIEHNNSYTILYMCMYVLCIHNND